MTVQKEVIEIKEKIPVMTYSQYRRARKLVHQCCNYESGNCLALDDGEECVCVQSISYSLLCRWFRAAVLPLDEPLDRAGISRKKGYIEADGTIRLYFTVEDAKAKLRRSRQVATRAFHELESCGLIFRRKQGLGRPAVITLNLPAKERRSAND